MRITASIQSEPASHQATVATNEVEKQVAVPPREGMPGSSLNGGELLFLSLAICYGNDIYREAAARDIPVERVDVMVEGEFGRAGEPARSISYRVRVAARAPEAMIVELIRHTDTVAEVHNTLRKGMPIELVSFEAVSISD